MSVTKPTVELLIPVTIVYRIEHCPVDEIPTTPTSARALAERACLEANTSGSGITVSEFICSIGEIEVNGRNLRCSHEQ